MTHNHFHVTAGSTNLNRTHTEIYELEQMQHGPSNISCLKNPKSLT